MLVAVAALAAAAVKGIWTDLADGVINSVSASSTENGRWKAVSFKEI